MENFRILIPYKKQECLYCIGLKKSTAIRFRHQRIDEQLYIMSYDKQVIKFIVTAFNGATIDAKISWKAEGYWK